MSAVTIRPVDPATDAAAIAGIYNYYIRETVITFETELLSPEEMQERIRTISERFPYLVCEAGGKVAGYAYANTWRTRAAYDKTVETTVYLYENQTGQGLGKKLYQALLDELKRLEFHAAVGSLTLPNPASVALHEKMGFRKVAHFPEVGRKFDQWLDVGFWHRLL